MGATTTDNLGASKPISTNQLNTDVERIRSAFDVFDNAIAARATTATLTGHTGRTDNPHSVTAAQVGAIPDAAGACTDTRIGNRTTDQTLVPGASTGNLTQLLSWITNRIRAITGGTNWYDAPATTLSATKSHIDATGNPHGTTAANVGAIPASNGAVTDALIGNRTVDQALATPGNTGTVLQLLSWLAGRILAITGAVNWTDAPATTLSNAATHLANTSNPHNTTAAQVGAPTTSGTGATGTWGISITGNAGTASRLATARAINGVNFDGSAAITVPGVKTIRTGSSAGTADRQVSIGATVDTSKSIVVASCVPGDTSLTVSGGTIGLSVSVSVIDSVAIINSTTLQITAGKRGASGNTNTTVNWTVVEFY